MIKYFRKKLRSRRNNLHNPDLIQKLHNEHKKLIKLFTNLAQNPTTKNFKKFMDELELHLLLEDTNLYENLQLRYSLCPANTLIQGVKEKIAEIVPTIEKLSEQIKNKTSKEEIDSTIEEIKNYLLKRIELEEEVLFDLYKDYFVCGEIEKKLKVFEDNHEDAEEFLEGNIKKES